MYPSMQWTGGVYQMGRGGVYSSMNGGVCLWVLGVYTTPGRHPRDRLGRHALGRQSTGQTPLGRHPPEMATEVVVRILLECILVAKL